MDRNKIQSNKTLQLPKEISGLINVAEENTEQDDLQPLTEIANKDNVALLAFIAPYVSKRVSPVRERYAVIGLAEEFGIEVAISQICSRLTDKKQLYILINSPGGLVSSSYQVARELRRNFENIVVFVLHVAASGGALIAMAGNEVVMGNMAHLSPIDVQVNYNGQRVSANAMEIAITKLADYFKDKLPEEAPYPWQVLAQKIDPILRVDWGAHINTIWRYAGEILSKSGYNQVDISRIRSNFIFTTYDHDFVINRDLARSYGFNIVENQKYDDVLDKMRPWLSKYMLEEGGEHVIRYILPSAKKQRIKREG